MVTFPSRPCRLRRVDGQWFETYIESFERVWATARPYDPDEAA